MWGYKGRRRVLTAIDYGPDGLPLRTHEEESAAAARANCKGRAMAIKGSAVQFYLRLERGDLTPVSMKDFKNWQEGLARDRDQLENRTQYTDSRGYRAREGKK